MTQQPTGIRLEAHCGVPIPCQGSTGQRGGGFARPYQQEGEKVNAIPRYERGYLQESADGFIWVVSVGLATVSDVVLMVVGVGDWKIMNHLGINYEDTMGTYFGSLDVISYVKIPVGSLVETTLNKS